MQPVKPLDFYFDFISPYAYFAFCRLDELDGRVDVRLRPVLFAGLLGHWESKGPAEIPSKRVFTYQYTHWYAHHHGIRFKAPPAHPFNPLGALRLAIACGLNRDAVQKIFEYIWADGLSVDDESAWTALATSLGVTDVAAATSDTAVKTQLRQSTDDALAAGVFGVPTYIVDRQLFWGVDALPMLLDYLADPALLNNEEMRRLANLPKAAERRI